MRTAMITLGIVAGMLVLAGGCDNGNGPEATLTADVLAKAQLEYYWGPRDVAQAVGFEEGETVQQVYLLDENLYLMTDLHRLIAVNAANGTVKWAKVVAPADHDIFAPVHADNVTLPINLPGAVAISDPSQAGELVTFDAVILNTISNMLVLDRSNGRVIRNIDLPFAATAGGATDGVNYYVPSTFGLYRAVTLREGIAIWSNAADGTVVVPPQTLGRRVYVASTGQTVRAIDSQAGNEVRWVKPTMGPVRAPFEVDSRGVFVADTFGRVYAYEPYVGTPLWDYPLVTNGQCYSPTQLGDNSVFQYSRDDQFYAIDITRGEPRWTMKEGRKVLALIDQMVYLLDDQGYLRLVNEMTGEQQARLPLTGFDLHAANVSGSGAFVANSDGKIALIRPQGAAYLTEEALRPDNRQLAD
jgi:outer membrane protein assembly factor BamB